MAENTESKKPQYFVVNNKIYDFGYEDFETMPYKLHIENNRIDMDGHPSNGKIVSIPFSGPELDAQEDLEMEEDKMQKKYIARATTVQIEHEGTLVNILLCESDKVLFVQNVAMKTLPNLTQFEGVEKIYIQNNCLKYIDFKCFPKSAKAIYVENNFITDVFSNFDNSPEQPKKIYIRNNKIELVSINFHAETTVEIHVINNNIKDLNFVRNDIYHPDNYEKESS